MPDSTSPSAVPPASSIFDLFERLSRAGTTACTCGAPLCPGTIARARRAAEPALKQEAASEPPANTAGESTQKAPMTRAEKINAMHALATDLGYRITDLVPFS